MKVARRLGEKRGVLRATTQLLCLLALLVFARGGYASLSPSLEFDGEVSPLEQHEQQLANTGGGERARLLAEMAFHYQRLDSSRSAAYARQALELLEAHPDPGLLALAKTAMAWSKLMKTRYSQALELSDEALQLAQPLANHELSGQILYTRGATHLNRGNIKLALQDFKASAAQLEKTDNQVALARAYTAIGRCYRHYSEFEAAMLWQHKAYELSSLSGDSAVHSVVINNLGDLYVQLGQHNKALEYSLKSLELDQSESFALLLKYLNIGQQYRALAQYDKALVSYHTALALGRKLNFPHHEAEILTSVGLTHLAMQEHEQALNWMNQALKAAENSQVETQIIGVLNSLSEVYVAKQDYAAATGMAWMAREMAETLGEPMVYTDSLQYLAAAYKAGGDYKNALETFELYNMAHARLLNERAKNRLAELQSSFESEVREREINLLKQEARIGQLQLEKQLNLRNIWIGGIASLLLVVLLVARRYLAEQRISRTDELTRIPNRGSISRHMKLELQRFQRYGSHFCVMMLDIDDFKRFNDTHGHDCGDAILSGVAELISKTIRNTDKVGRWGGEEFVVLFPQTGLDEARRGAERVRAAIDQQLFSANSAQPSAVGTLHVSITGGLSAVETTDRDISEVLKRADAAMYDGKKAGKNSVHVLLKESAMTSASRLALVKR